MMMKKRFKGNIGFWVLGLGVLVFVSCTSTGAQDSRKKRCQETVYCDVMNDDRVDAYGNLDEDDDVGSGYLNPAAKQTSSDGMVYSNVDMSPYRDEGADSEGRIRKTSKRVRPKAYSEGTSKRRRRN